MNELKQFVSSPKVLIPLISLIFTAGVLYNKLVEINTTVVHLEKSVNMAYPEIHQNTSNIKQISQQTMQQDSLISKLQDNESLQHEQIKTLSTEIQNNQFNKEDKRTAQQQYNQLTQTITQKADHQELTAVNNLLFQLLLRQNTTIKH